MQHPPRQDRKRRRRQIAAAVLVAFAALAATVTSADARSTGRRDTGARRLSYRVSVRLTYLFVGTESRGSQLLQRQNFQTTFTGTELVSLVRTGTKRKPVYALRPFGTVSGYVRIPGQIDYKGTETDYSPTGNCWVDATLTIPPNSSARTDIALSHNAIQRLSTTSPAETTMHAVGCGVDTELPGAYGPLFSPDDPHSATLPNLARINRPVTKEIKFGKSFTLTRQDSALIDPDHMHRRWAAADLVFDQSWSYRWELTFKPSRPGAS